MPVRGLVLVTALSLVALGGVGAAHAAILTPSCTEYANSAVPVGCPTAAATATVLSTPGAYVYGDASLEPATNSGGTISGSAYPGSYPGASFYDAFVIQIGNSQGESLSTTLDFGKTLQITNFEERLYQYTGTAPTIAAIPSAIDFWTLPLGGLGTVGVLPPTDLPAGTYVLEVRGDVTGSAGGGYGGILELSPVPVPDTVWLFVSGIALLALARLTCSQRAVPSLSFPG